MSLTRTFGHFTFLQNVSILTIILAHKLELVDWNLGNS